MPEISGDFSVLLRYMYCAMTVLTAQQETKLKRQQNVLFLISGMNSFNGALMPIKYVGVLLKCTRLIAV
jgi:hypothetical protein